MQNNFDLELVELNLERYNEVFKNGTKGRYYKFVKNLFAELEKNDSDKNSSEDLKAVNQLILQ